MKEPFNVDKKHNRYIWWVALIGIGLHPSNWTHLKKNKTCCIIK